MSELKPCPFCGKKPDKYAIIKHKESCCLNFPFESEHDVKKVISQSAEVYDGTARWNTRPIEDRAQRADCDETYSKESHAKAMKIALKVMQEIYDKQKKLKEQADHRAEKDVKDGQANRS